MGVYTYGNVKIFHEVGRTEAVLLAHGSYKPRGWFDKGSGKVIVPPKVTIHFYAAKDEFAVGSLGRVYEALTQQPRQPKEIAHAGQKVINYSLFHKERKNSLLKDEQWLATTAVRDYIGVTKDEVATLGDVFAAIAHFKLPYKVLHNYHCRVTEETAEKV